MERGISDQIAEQAAYWDARLRAPDCTAAERARYAEWSAARPEHREAFEQLQTIAGSLRHHGARADLRAIRDAALRAKPLGVRRLFPLAASIAALAAVATLLMTSPAELRSPALAKLSTVLDSFVSGEQARFYETGVGQRSTVALADGSSIDLNAKTRIKVALDAAVRRIELIEGQAFFHVARDPQRPFVVRAAGRDITAVGTAFDVRLDTSLMRVTLLEGKVKVTDEVDSSRASTAIESSARTPGAVAESTQARASAAEQPVASAAEIFLVPGEQLVTALSSSHTISVGTSDPAALPRTSVVRTIDVAKVTGWREGRVFLEDLTLAEAVDEMNRHSPVEIRLGDPRLASLRVNGMFRAGEQTTFVAALEQYFPIAADHQDGTAIVLTRRR